MTKKEYEKIIGHNIREDTYLICEGIKNGEIYSEIYNKIDNNRELYGIKRDTSLTREKTALKYIEQVYGNKSKNERKTTANSNVGGGIYGIYCDDELIYIGKANNFHKRFTQHRSNIINRLDKHLYRLINERMLNFDTNVRFVPLIVVEKLNTDLEITKRDLSMMELALITLYQPPGNIEGRLQPYKTI